MVWLRFFINIVKIKTLFKQSLHKPTFLKCISTICRLTAISAFQYYNFQLSALLFPAPQDIPMLYDDFFYKAVALFVFSL